MDGIGQEQHPDVVAEVGQRLGQGLAVLATLGEALARLAAEEMRRREQRAEDAERADELERRERKRTGDRDSARAAGVADDELAQHAERRREAQRDRRLIAQTLDSDWLARADLLDLAVVWRAARLRENEFSEARVAAEAVEDRLREMYLGPMDLYDRSVGMGASRAEAMAAAAFQMAQTRPARPYGGRRSPAVGPGAAPMVGVERFDAAVCAERARLVDGEPGAGFAAELERLGAGGAAAAQALREMLEVRAGEQRRHGQAAASVVDDPATAGVDEHASGLPRSARDAGDGDRDEAAARTAAQLAAEWFPGGLQHPQAMPDHVAGQHPAAARTQMPAGKRTPARTR
jgi:hypothetical protein